MKEDDTMSVHVLLEKLGLNSQDTRTYEALLELESVSIRKVAEATGINRGTTYESIKRLVSQGLVSNKTIGSRDYYSAESPEKIFDIIREKRKDLLEAQQQAQSIIPGLLAQKVRPQGRPLVRYYEDDEGVTTILRDVLQTTAKLSNPEYYVYSTKSLRQYIYRKMPQFTDRRISQGITVKVIAIGAGGEKMPNSERKWLDEPTDSPVSSYTIIYGDKVAQISISNDYTPYGVVIEDAGNASTQRLLFDRLWREL